MASCYTLSKALIYEDMVVILLMLQILLTEDPEIKYLLSGAPSRSVTSLLFCLCSEFKMIFKKMTDKADSSVDLWWR